MQVVDLENVPGSRSVCVCVLEGVGRWWETKKGKKVSTKSVHDGLLWETVGAASPGVP